MPKNKKGAGNTEPADETQKLYARAYASRLAKQVTEELHHSPRKTTTPKKPRPPRQT